VYADELKKSGQKIKQPSYLNIGRDITDLEEFKTHTIAKKDFCFKPENEID